MLYTAATPDYFDVFSIRLVRGRLFTDEDHADTEPVVVIDAAERYWPGEDPVGRVVSVDDVQEGDEFVPRWRTIVGVVEHVRNYELTETSRVEAYVAPWPSRCAAARCGSRCGPRAIPRRSRPGFGMPCAGSMERFRSSA